MRSMSRLQGLKDDDSSDANPIARPKPRAPEEKKQGLVDQFWVSFITHRSLTLTRLFTSQGFAIKNNCDIFVLFKSLTFLEKILHPHLDLGASTFISKTFYANLLETFSRNLPPRFEDF